MASNSARKILGIFTMVFRSNANSTLWTFRTGDIHSVGIWSSNQFCQIKKRGGTIDQKLIQATSKESTDIGQVYRRRENTPWKYIQWDWTLINANLLATKQVGEAFREKFRSPEIRILQKRQRWIYHKAKMSLCPRRQIFSALSRGGKLEKTGRGKRGEIDRICIAHGGQRVKSGAAKATATFRFLSFLYTEMRWNLPRRNCCLLGGRRWIQSIRGKAGPVRRTKLRYAGKYRFESTVLDYRAVCIDVGSCWTVGCSIGIIICK